MNSRISAGRLGRKWTFLALAGMAATFFGSAALAAVPYNSTPTRIIGPGVINQMPAPAGGWTAADNRIVGAPLIGQGGWTGGAASCNSENYDEEISHAAAHSGNQSLRLSNWYAAGCVDSIISPAFTAVGETGSISASNASPSSKTVAYDFWFRSVSTTADPQNDMVTSLSGLASYRQTYLEAYEEQPGDANSHCADIAAGCYNLISTDVTAGPPGTTHQFNNYYSPDLQRGAWYHVVISATFNDGADNDQVRTQVFDANGNPFWDQTTGSWEYAYAHQLFGSSPLTLAVDHVTFDMASTSISTTGTYSTSPRPQGTYIDDMTVTPGSGAGFSVNFDGNRYVAASGGNDTVGNDCSDSTNPCLTIAYAISQSQPYNVIHVAAGTYAPVTAPVIALEGLQIIGDPGNKPKLARVGGSINQQLLVISGAKNVHVENFEFDMDQSFVAEGLLANGFVDGLTVANNYFLQSRSNASANSSYRYRNAISINDDNGNSASLGLAPGSNVSITGNVIDGAPDLVNGVYQRIGIDMDNGTGLISGNTVTAGVHDIRVRFGTIVGTSSGTTTAIDGNTLSGRGLEYDAPNAGVGAITISNNQINAAAGANGTTVYGADVSLVRLIDNQQKIPTTLSGNTFQGHTGSYRGVLVENYPGVQLTGNTFTPASNASDFVSLVVSNKEINANVPAIAPYPLAISAQGNTFNGSATSNAGRAVELLNDNDSNGSAAFGAVTFGGNGANLANSFDANLRWYFHLDNYNCNTVSSPTCTFLNYGGAIGSAAGTDTQVRPFRSNVLAADNLFGGVAPAAMSPVQRGQLNAQTFDVNDDSSLGLVDYGLGTGVVVSLNGPVANVQATVPTTYTGEITNTGAALTENALVHITISSDRVGGIQAGDVTAQYDAGGGNYQPLPLTLSGGALVVDFGPTGGFAIPAGYDATTFFRFAFNYATAAGTNYTEQAALTGVTTGTVYGADTHATNVVRTAANIILSLAGPPTTTAGAATSGYTAHLVNTGGATTENVRIDFKISRSGSTVAAGDLTLEYNAGSSYQTIPLTVCGNDLCGSLGSAGFPVPVGYDATTMLRATFEKTGAWTIDATLVGINTSQQYAAGSLAVQVGAGAAATIVPNGPTSFNGTAGSALPTPLPSVIVKDVNGNPVSGVTVTFAAAANSGTLTGAVQTTDANGIATLGGWTLNATPGTNTVTATAAGVSDSVTFTAQGTAAIGALQVTITDNRDYVQFDHSLTVIATIGNTGSSDIAAVHVNDVLPIELDVGVNAWQCIAFNGATCAANATRDLNVTVSLPAHSSVTYLLNATVNRNGTDEITHTITAADATATGTPPATATDTTTIVIFRNGFEQGGDGAETILPALDGANAATLNASGQVALDVSAAAIGSLRVTAIAQATDGTFRVEALRIGSAVWLRLVAHDATVDTFSPWSEVGKGGAMLALGNAGTQLILVGTAQDLDLTLAKAGPFALSHVAH